MRRRIDQHCAHFRPIVVAQPRQRPFKRGLLRDVEIDENDGRRLARRLDRKALREEALAGAALFPAKAITRAIAPGVSTDSPSHAWMSGGAAAARL